MGRRSQLEICLDILKAVAEGRRKPTHIMYRANLSWVRLKKYINFLIAQGLLREIINDNNQNSPHFSLTRKGKEVVKYYMEIKMIMQNNKNCLEARLNKPSIKFFCPWFGFTNILYFFISSATWFLEMSVRALLHVKPSRLKETNIQSCRFSRICPIYSPGENGKCIHKGEKRCKEFIRAMITSEL